MGENICNILNKVLRCYIYKDFHKVKYEKFLNDKINGQKGWKLFKEKKFTWPIKILAVDMEWREKFVVKYHFIYTMWQN